MEEHGLIYSAGLWILRTAFQEAKEWIKKKPDFTISVNVSALQFFEETFLEDLYQTIEEGVYFASVKCAGRQENQEEKI